MTPVAPKLIELLKDFTPNPSQIPMISTVTKEVLIGHEVTPDYWVQNLVGTVRYVDAVQKAVQLYDVHTFLEIGPHPALQGPARQTLAELGVAMEKPYFGSLIRFEDEVQKMLAAATSLHNLGAEISWDAVFWSVGRSTVLRGLPSFPWQRQKYWHESEASIKCRFREATHELLGRKIPHNIGAWESEITLDKSPYLKDHVVQGNIIFPGAGYCSLGIAAATALAQSEGTPTTSAQLEDVSFKRPMIFDSTGAIKTQVILDKDGDKTTFSTLVGEGSNRWQEVSTGVLGKFSQDDLANSPVDIQSIKQRCPAELTQKEIYSIFLEAGLEYGPNFQGISKLSRGESEAIGELVPPLCASSVDYLLHPTILDATFQCLLGAVSGLSGSYLPTILKSLKIYRPCHEPLYYVHAISKEVNARILLGDMIIYSASGHILAHVEGLQCNSIGKKSSVTDTMNWSSILAETVWKPLLLSSNPEALKKKISEITSSSALPRDADKISVLTLQNGLKQLKKEGIEVVEKHKNLADWATSHPTEHGEIPTVDSEDLESNIAKRVGDNIIDILSGKKDSLSVVFEDGLLHSIYEHGPTFSAANTVVKSLVDLLAHKNPNLRILEIGAGTGGTTSHVLPHLAHRFGSYTYTDISPSFFEAAKTKFQTWVHKMKFSVLNIEKDPIEQGFEEGSYDLILATDVLHATRLISNTLANVRKLVAPGGTLVLNELTNPPLWVHIVFGTLSGWWAYQDPEVRELGPTLSVAGWRKALGEAGFSSVLDFPDRVGQGEPIHSIFAASTNPIIEDQQDAWEVISSGSSLARELVGLLGASTKIVSEDDLSEENNVKNVIYLLETDETEIFKGITDKRLAGLKKIAGTASKAIWVVNGSLYEVTEPNRTPLIGFVRSVLNEYPALNSLIIDTSLSSENNSALYIKQSIDSFLSNETEVAYNQGLVLVPRVLPKSVDESNNTLGELDISHVPVQLEVGTPGLLSTLQWREVKNQPPLPPNEVEIAVRATGLNFKDIMLSMGLLGEEAVEGGYCTNNLGIECAGEVVGVGSEVTGLALGQRVVVVAKNCFSSRVRTVSTLAVKIPEHISFEEAATIPATFLTASYALNYLARLAPGESVLVHAAAGGVGIAAIQLCKLAGAEVYATVGSDSKRKFVRDVLGVPDDHIFNSRTLEFVEQIKKHTKGRGVDIVLNSLSGDALKKSVTLLAPFGRFLEIGKRDIYSNSKLDMLPFGQNISFFAIDLDRLNGQRPQLGGKLFRDLMDSFTNKELQPLPVTQYGFTQIEQAFRFMQQGKHIGKVVLSLTPGDKALVLPSRTLFRADKFYLLVGGLGGFGRAVALWMASRGANKLAFLSRSGKNSADAQETIKALEDSGVLVRVFAGDVTDKDTVHKVVEEIEKETGLSGVIQGAMVLEDTLVGALSSPIFNKVLHPKVAGTYNLHTATSHLQLEFFMTFSSISAVVGNMSQSNYAAANVYMDSLAQWRVTNGLPANSINWGAIGDVGYVATRQDLQANMAKRGIHSLPSSEAFKVIEYAIGHPFESQIIAAPITYSVAKRTLPALGLNKFSHLLRVEEDKASAAGTSSSQGSSSGKSQVGQRLASAQNQEEKKTIVLEALQEKLASMLNVAQEQVEKDHRLSDLGVDSLMAVEMKNWIGAELRAPSISVLDLTGSRSLVDIAAKIAQEGNNPATANKQSSATQEKETTSDWFVQYSSPEKASYRLVCFPHLGGSASAYKDWVALLPQAELWAFQPSATARTWPTLLENLSSHRAFTVENGLPIIIYGHSLGGMTAFELILELEKKDVKIHKLIIGGSGSPRYPNQLINMGTEWSDSYVENLDGETLMNMMVIGGFLETTLSPEVVRSNMLLGRRYLSWIDSRGGLEKKILAPIDVLIGTNDHLVNIERAGDWQQFTTNEFSLHSIPNAPHLFLLQDPSNFFPVLSPLLL
eukprot:TRINITY_DN5503_c0_g1_i1.p1 TRINITY_DN5503_c0_g1~~TRINITY_DN5503_c0_g1_i1.p1  ORF type:complete len:1988 (-),score=362.33 TRINITY_DN5503_c0_g1_i1:138-5957(-)